MSKWKTAEIHANTMERVSKATAGWDAEALRNKLVDVLAASYPIRVTLEGLADNPNVPHGGMNVTSGMWPEQFGRDEDLEAPWGAVYNPETPGHWDYVAYKWGDPEPVGIEHSEVSFAAGEVLHPDTPILSVCKYMTAASIFVGTFDLTDVRSLQEACRL